MDNYTTTQTKNPNEEKLNKQDAPGTEPARQHQDARTFSREGVQQAGVSLKEAAEDAGAYVGHKAQDAASYVGHKTQDAAHYVGQKTGDASEAVGGGLRSLGQSVREHGPEGGRAGDASTAVADSLESSGRYLQEEGIQEMAEDVTNLVRRNPIPALVIGVAAGYLIGRATTPRS